MGAERVDAEVDDSTLLVAFWKSLAIMYHRISFMTWNLKHHHATITNNMEKICDSCVFNSCHKRIGDWLVHDGWICAKERSSP